MVNVNNMLNPILITGCARSGTSLVAGTINICGAFGGRMSGPNRNNAKGMFENPRIRNQIIKRYLIRIGVDQLGQYPLPDVNNLPKFSSLNDKIFGIIKDDGYTGGPWMYKGAKMCLIWPLIHKAFPTAKWVIIRRNDIDIINSCMRTGFMRAFRSSINQSRVGAKSEAAGWAWWVNEHKKRFQEMKAAGLNMREIWPETMINGDLDSIKDLIAWLGLEWNNKAADFIEPKLWQAKKRKDI